MIDPLAVPLLEAPGPDVLRFIEAVAKGFVDQTELFASDLMALLRLAVDHVRETVMAWLRGLLPV
jgi:hypothetical protein